jgi:dTMP kinase
MDGLRGKFIVLDGGEGCGKSTQTHLLRAALEQRSVPALVVRDPGATHIGEEIRAILLNPNQAAMSMRCEMLLYMAARAQLMNQIISPALAAGSCVICDRFVSSTLAYQLGGDALTADEIIAVAQVAIRGRWPDLTLILDMPLEQSHQRLARPKDRIEQRSMQYHQQVRDNYLAQAAADPARYRVIQAGRQTHAVHADILAAVLELAEKK